MTYPEEPKHSTCTRLRCRDVSTKSCPKIKNLDKPKTHQRSKSTPTTLMLASSWGQLHPAGKAFHDLPHQQVSSFSHKAETMNREANWTITEILDQYITWNWRTSRESIWSRRLESNITHRWSIRRSKITCHGSHSSNWPIAEWLYHDWQIKFKIAPCFLFS